MFKDWENQTTKLSNKLDKKAQLRVICSKFADPKQGADPICLHDGETQPTRAADEEQAAEKKKIMDHPLSTNTNSVWNTFFKD